MHNRKSQAAMEFLSTYGWAFLVILVIMGVLAYFGILNPSKFLPSRCSFSPEFGCLDSQMDSGSGSANGIVRLRLKNNAGKAISIGAGKIILSAESGAPVACLGPFVTPPAAFLPISGWKSAETKDFLWTSCDLTSSVIVPGSKGKLLVAITFYPADSGSNFERTSKGELFSAVTSNIAGNSSTVSSTTCQNAATAGLCDGLDLIFGAGYKCSCCSAYSLCCTGC